MLLLLATGLQIKCFHKKQHSTTTELIFRVQFHTCFVKDFEMVFTKDELDEAHRGVLTPVGSLCWSARCLCACCNVPRLPPNRQAFP